MSNQVIQNDNLHPEQSRMRQLILIISLIGLIATTILTVTAVVDNNTTEIIINSITVFVLIISLISAWLGSVAFGRIALPTIALVSISYLSIIGEGIHDPGNLAFAIVIAISALLLGAKGLIIFGSLTAGAIFAIAQGGILGIFQHSPASTPDIIAALMGVVVSSIILFINTRQLEQGLIEIRLSEKTQIQINQELMKTKVSLEKQSQELAEVNEQNTYRVKQLRLVAEVANSAASIQTLDKLLPTISDLISQRFGIYHTGIFLIDDNREYSILYAASSAGGKKMLARRHRLRVGSEGLVGFVTGRGQARVALDVGMDSVHFDNPDLPDTHSEIALPLKIAGETIGALDLQSTEVNAFAPEDVEVLSILANQLTIAIQSARSLEAAHQAVQDAETAYRQLTGETWSQFLYSRKVSGYHFDGIEARSMLEDSNDENELALIVPVRLRGQEIGKLKLTSLESGRVWSEDEITMAESAAERAALSLENARLLENAQKRAAKERAISEGAARVSAALDVENILQITAEELERALGSSEVVIQLGSTQ